MVGMYALIAITYKTTPVTATKNAEGKQNQKNKF